MGASGFAGGFAAGILPGMAIGDKLRQRKIENELGEAGKISPEEISAMRMQETTAGAKDMVYDEDTGQYLPRYMDSTTPSGMTDQGLSQNMATEDSPQSVPGIMPTFDAKTSKRYRMGGKEQETPFTQEQIDAARFRNQADVYSRYGKAEDAAKLQGLAKTREEEGINSQIRAGAMDGIKNTKDMKDEERMFAMSKGMYEQSIKLGRPDLAAGYYNQMTTNRDALLSRANERADRVFRATGNISGFVDAYNRYVADGLSIDSFKRNDDGSHTFTMNDGNGAARDITVPKERTQEYLLALRDPKRIGELEAKRAEILFKSQADAQEALNKPVAVGKDQTLVVPSTGQTFAPRGSRGFDPKEAGSVLDDTRRILLERSGNFDQATGKWNWSPETTTKAVTAERLFASNPNLGPAELAEIADKGQGATATVEVGGKQQRVPAIIFNGRTYLLGGESNGHQQPSVASKPAAATVTTTGLGTREVRGKISPSQGIEPMPTHRVGPQSSADGFPSVSKGEQFARDIEAGKLLVAEAGGLEGARRDLAELDAALKNPKLDGTQRAILSGQRNRLVAGINAITG